MYLKWRYILAFTYDLKKAKAYSNWSRMYANFASPWPSTRTCGHSCLACLFSGSEYITLRGFDRSKVAHFSMLSAGFMSVCMMPTRCASRVLAFCLKSSVRAIWCCAKTRREIRDTNIRLMNASSWSGSRYGEDRERPRTRDGIMEALRTDYQNQRKMVVDPNLLFIEYSPKKLAEFYIFGHGSNRRKGTESSLCNWASKSIQRWRGALTCRKQSSIAARVRMCKHTLNAEALRTSYTRATSSWVTTMNGRACMSRRRCAMRTGSSVLT